MSCLFVQPHHFWLSLIGYKWQTRRLWDSQRVKAGNSYRLLRVGVDDMFTPREDAPAYAVVRGVWTERLEALNDFAARAEGGYTVSEFYEEWEAINGDWHIDQEVYVVEYDTVVEDPRAYEQGSPSQRSLRSS